MEQHRNSTMSPPFGRQRNPGAVSTFITSRKVSLRLEHRSFTAVTAASMAWSLVAGLADLHVQMICMRFPPIRSARGARRMVGVHDETALSDRSGHVLAVG